MGLDTGFSGSFVCGDSRFDKLVAHGYVVESTVKATCNFSFGAGSRDSSRSGTISTKVGASGEIMQFVIFSVPLELPLLAGRKALRGLRLSIVEADKVLLVHPSSPQEELKSIDLMGLLGVEFSKEPMVVLSAGGAEAMDGGAGESVRLKPGGTAENVLAGAVSELTEEQVRKVHKQSHPSASRMRKFLNASGFSGNNVNKLIEKVVKNCEQCPLKGKRKTYGTNMWRPSRKNKICWMDTFVLDRNRDLHALLVVDVGTRD